MLGVEVAVFVICTEPGPLMQPVSLRYFHLHPMTLFHSEQPNWLAL
jgi:hypothetical protein